MAKNSWAKGRKETTLVRVDREAHEAAKEMAHKEKKSLSQWLKDVIMAIARLNL